jgi:hypothetical protein
LKLVGMLLLLFGGTIVVAALALLRHPAERTAFIAAGLAIELLGLTLTARDYAQTPHPERRIAAEGRIQ